MKIVSDFIKYIPPAEDMDESTHHKEARKLYIEVPVEENGKFDVFINDFIRVVVYLNNNKSRLEVAPYTVIHAVSNHPSSEDHILKDNMIESDKCLVEGALAEEKICLGWTLNSRELLVQLSIHKYKA